MRVCVRLLFDLIYICDYNVIKFCLKAGFRQVPETVYELPYNGAKEMLFVDNVDNREFLIGLFNAMYDELPTPKKKNLLM